MPWLLAGCCAIVCATDATEYAIDGDKSLFSVVTHKAGVAAKLAHNHLIHATAFDATLAIPAEGFEKAEFSLSLNVADLVADDPDAQQKWYPLISAADVLDEPFKTVEAADRATIREHMLAPNQLDGAAYPKIEAKLLSVREEEGGETGSGYIARVALTVKGKTVERDCKASFAKEDDHILIDAHGRFRFTEFGIKPYSAFLGAVKNADEFDVVVHIVAK